MKVSDWLFTDIGNYVRIDKYIGNDTDIVVPNKINQKPTVLLSIDENVIPNIRTITSLSILPSSTGWKVGLETDCLMNVFKDNEVLEKVNLSGINTSKVRDMRNMFAKCTKLKKLDISSFETTNLKFSENMFFYNSSLIFLKMDKFNMKLLNISKTFAYFFELYQIPLLLVTNDRGLHKYTGFTGSPFNRVPFSTILLEIKEGEFKENKNAYFCKVFYTSAEFDVLNRLSVWKRYKKKEFSFRI